MLFELQQARGEDGGRVESLEVSFLSHLICFLFCICFIVGFVFFCVPFVLVNFFENNYPGLLVLSLPQTAASQGGCQKSVMMLHQQQHQQQQQQQQKSQGCCYKSTGRFSIGGPTQTYLD